MTNPLKHEIQQDVGEPVADEANIADFKTPLNLGVTIPAVIAILAIVIWGLAWPDSFSMFASSSLNWVVESTSWLFALTGTIFVFFIVSVTISKFGRVRLGKDTEKPKFPTPSWIAMMFTVGMGIGLMSYGAAEPLAFYRESMPGHEPKGVGTAMASTMFHWTLHPWSLYAIAGLAIAYLTYRLGRKQLISATFILLIGVRRAEGWLGKLIDALTIFATVFGTAASLGVGVLQISAGLEINGFTAIEDTSLWIGLILILGYAFLASALPGVGKGIQYISNFNMAAATLLALLVLILGPTVVILNLIPTSIGSYLDSFFEMAARFSTSADGAAGEWLPAWTIFYWAWWISWSPFVGMLIARISHGCTIREFVFTVVAVPSIVSAAWFSIFGGGAITHEQQHSLIYDDGSAEGQLFNLLDSMPGGAATSVIVMILLVTFFITSADSASTVMGTVSQFGQLTAFHSVTAMWGIFTALIAIVLPATGGSDALSNLQNLTILAASPLVIVILALMAVLARGLSGDPMYLDDEEWRQFALCTARERRLVEATEQRKRRRARKLHN